MKPCSKCNDRRAVLKRPKDGSRICKECFFATFEDEIHRTIIDNRLFHAGDRIAVGASGGKDSTVLIHVLDLLNRKYNYNIDIQLVSVDEGIHGYRDDSLKTVKRNQQQYGLPLTIVSYEDLYNGWTMDRVVSTIGKKNNCTFCGVFRRQALDRGAAKVSANLIATGHNADDIAETVIMNLLRGDISRLGRCCDIVTPGLGSAIRRCKPFKYTYEKEIVMYAYLKKLDYFSTECIYSPEAYRGFARAYIKDLERIRPSSIIDIIRSGEQLHIHEEVKAPIQRMPLENVSSFYVENCQLCGFISSNTVCKACKMLDGLNSGIPMYLLPLFVH